MGSVVVSVARTEMVPHSAIYLSCIWHLSFISLFHCSQTARHISHSPVHYVHGTKFTKPLHKMSENERQMMEYEMYESVF